MNPRMLSFFLAVLYLADFSLAAPLPVANSLYPGALVADKTTTAAPDVRGDAKKTRVLRLDVVSLSELSSKASEAPKYILDATLGLLETSPDAEIVPVFSVGKDKTVIVDANGELLTMYGEEKFVPVWARPWKSHGFRRTLRVSQGLAMFILGFSLAIALVCSYIRGLCSQQSSTSLELGMFEEGLGHDYETRKSKSAAEATASNA